MTLLVVLLLTKSLLTNGSITKVPFQSSFLHLHLLVHPHQLTFVNSCLRIVETLFLVSSKTAEAILHQLLAMILMVLQIMVMPPRKWLHSKT